MQSYAGIERRGRSRGRDGEIYRGALWALPMALWLWLLAAGLLKVAGL